jgi:hypothetical protein
MDVADLKDLKDSRKGIFLLAGSVWRVPQRHFWNLKGFNEDEDNFSNFESNEKIHFSVRLLLAKTRLPAPKLLWYAQRPNGKALGETWHLPRKIPLFGKCKLSDHSNRVSEEEPIGTELDILEQWSMREFEKLLTSFFHTLAQGKLEWSARRPSTPMSPHTFVVQVKAEVERLKELKLMQGRRIGT